MAKMQTVVDTADKAITKHSDSLELEQTKQKVAITLNRKH
jgi:hypothetical protein